MAYTPFTDLNSYQTAQQVAQMLGGSVVQTPWDNHGGDVPVPTGFQYQVNVGNHGAYTADLAKYLNQNNGNSMGYGWMNLPGTTTANMVAPTYNLNPQPAPAGPLTTTANNTNVSSATRPGMTPPPGAPATIPAAPPVAARPPAVDPTRMQAPPPPVVAQPPQATPPVVAPRAATPDVRTAPGVAPQMAPPPTTQPAAYTPPPAVSQPAAVPPITAPQPPSATGGRPPGSTGGSTGFQFPPLGGSSGSQGGSFSFGPGPSGPGSNGGFNFGNPFGGGSWPTGGNAGYGPPPSNPWTGSSFLGDQTNDIGYLRGVAQNAGYATDATPAWQAMIAAQQDNINRNKAQIAEQFNVQGGRFSTGFGDALQKYMGQATLDQNSQLTQATMQSQEAARQRELQAAGQLGGFAYQGASQLSQQDYGMQQLQQQQALQAALQGASGSDSAAALMAQLGAQGVNSMNQYANQAAGQMYGGEQNAAQNLWNASNQGAGQLWNQSNQAATGMYNAQNQMLPQMMQYDTALRSLGLQGANNLSQNWMTNLNLGNQMGQSDWAVNSDNLNRQYQQWLQSQPAYSPYLPYMYQAATSQPLMYTPGYAPSQFGQTVGGIGGLLQGIGSIYKP